MVGFFHCWEEGGNGSNYYMEQVKNNYYFRLFKIIAKMFNQTIFFRIE